MLGTQMSNFSKSQLWSRGLQGIQLPLLQSYFHKLKIFPQFYQSLGGVEINNPLMGFG